MSIVLLGGGGHASDVLSVIEALRSTGSVEAEPSDNVGVAAGKAAGSRYEPIYVADDAWHEPERFEGREAANGGWPVKMVESIAAGAVLAPFVVALGYPVGRRAVHDMAEAAGGVAAGPIVHPDTSIGAGVELGVGVVVMGQTWVSPLVRLGRHTHVGYGVTIGHDTRIGPFCSVMPGACLGGDITIGEGVLVGANATVLQGLTIGRGATIGAGAVVTTDVPPDTTVIGVPARPTAGRPATAPWPPISNTCD